MSNIIDLCDVRKIYRRGSETIAAVNGVSLSIAPGEFVFIIGPSASGKTTLLNLIGCVEKPDSGQVRIDGVETARLSERALTRIRGGKIGFIFQQFFLMPTLTVRENVELPAVFLGANNGAARASALVEQVGLAGRAGHLPSRFSGGEMQRVAIARALINSPRILVADEPTGSLDTKTAQAILQVLHELNRSGLTIVMVTHNAELVRETGRIVALRDGELISASVSPARA